jgi:acyl carrier protein
MTQNIRPQALSLLMIQLKSEVDATSIADERSIEDLGLSSLDLVNLMYDLEEAFNIELDPEEMLSIGTVGQLMAQLEAKVAARSLPATAV